MSLERAVFRKENNEQKSSVSELGILYGEVCGISDLEKDCDIDVINGEPSVLFHKLGSMSDGEFNKFFAEKEDFRQHRVGNCRQLGGLDTIVDLIRYEEWIRSSVRIAYDNSNNPIFVVRLPIDAGPGQVSYHKVTSRKMYAEDVKLVQTQVVGLRALVIAAAEKIEGCPDVEPRMMGRVGSTAKMWTAMLGGISTRWVEEKEQYEQVLSMFKRGENMLVLAVEQGDDYEKQLGKQEELILRRYEDRHLKGGYRDRQHIISVEDVIMDQEGAILGIVVSNPWDSCGEYVLEYDELEHKVKMIEFATFNEGQANSVGTPPPCSSGSAVLLLGGADKILFKNSILKKWDGALLSEGH